MVGPTWINVSGLGSRYPISARPDGKGARKTYQMIEDVEPFSLEKCILIREVIQAFKILGGLNGLDDDDICVFHGIKFRK